MTGRPDCSGPPDPATTVVVATSGPKPYREGRGPADTIGAADRFVRSLERRAMAGELSIDDLAALAALDDRLHRLIDTTVRWLLQRDECSTREIGDALGVTRQAVQRRWPGWSARPPGGQEAKYR